jgi:membrane protease YdiL (CAAX protease family)
MAPLGAALATVLAAALVILQPVRGRRRYERLLEAVRHDPEARIRHYRRGITAEWAAVGLVALIGLLTSRTPGSIGLTFHGLARERSEVLEAVIVLALSAVVFRFGGGAIKAALRSQAKGFLALLPQRSDERWKFVGLAVTAGVCEEILFRGFGIAYVRWLWPSASHAPLVVITSVVFGLAHLYQGPRGVILTGILGAVFAAMTLAGGTLVPAIIVHALVDLRVLALPDLGPAPDQAEGMATGGG